MSIPDNFTVKSSAGSSASTGFGAFIRNSVGSLFNKLTGAGLTTAQQQQQDYQTEMSNTAFQRQVADMSAAGLNPALLYGHGAGAGASTPTGVDAASNGASLGEMMQVMLLGKQAKLLDSQAAKNTAEAGLTDRNAAWVDRLNDAQLKENLSRVRLNESQVDLNEYDKAYKAAQTALVDVQAKYQGALMQAQTQGALASAARNYAEAAISRMEKDLGHRLSSSELLAVIDSITALFGNKNNPTGKTIKKTASKVADAAVRVHDAQVAKTRRNRPTRYSPFGGMTR